MTTILSIQSSVAYGHVGNSAAVFPLMRMGVDVWPVATVYFSNHTGYETARGPVLGAEGVREVVAGIDERGVLGRCDAVLSGYLGEADVARAVLDTVALVRRRNPAAIFCCDPVMGDVSPSEPSSGAFYVLPGIPELIRDTVVRHAQVITPNQFELGFLTGRPTRTLAEVVSAAEYARSMGPDTVLVTSVAPPAAEVDTLVMVGLNGLGTWSVSTPVLPQTFTGAGDLAAAVLLARLLRGDDLPQALGNTAAVLFGVLSATAAAGEAELLLVGAQDEMVHPSRRFEVRRLR